ncbi:hypothetical protein T484DRAFT_1931278 [Baffinella frigidus]|nr:hypothetical protein T484DRAFT_1931278 [Cryptophyta sp. CCMP2293]
MSDARSRTATAKRSAKCESCSERESVSFPTRRSSVDSAVATCSGSNVAICSATPWSSSSVPQVASLAARGGRAPGAYCADPPCSPVMSPVTPPC